MKLLCGGITVGHVAKGSRMNSVTSISPNIRAKPLLRRGNKGGTRPGHVWVAHAPHDVFCEGLDPLLPTWARKFAPNHVGDIVRGDKFLRKLWRTDSGDEFTSRHCLACGRVIEGV